MAYSVIFGHKHLYGFEEIEAIMTVNIDGIGSYWISMWETLSFSGFIVPLLFYSLLLAIYAAFLWHFYKSVSKRDLLRLNLDRKHSWKNSTVYVVKYLFTFPALTFFWFFGLSAILFLLSKSQTTTDILTISMALVAAARITAYYKEGVAEEIAKILPLGVLAIFVVDPTYFSIDLTLRHFYGLPALAPLLINYLFFAVILELILRILFMIKVAIVDVKKGKTKARTKE